MKIYLFYFLLVVGAGSTHIIHNVPFVMQESQYCGPASLSSILSYYGDPVDQKTIAQSVFSPTLRGALITDLDKFCKERGYHTKIGQGTVDDIKTFVAENRPVVVLVDLGFWIISKQHYLVVYGFNERGFFVHDGFEASRLYPYETFEKIWKKAGNSYLLVYP